jgi:hypothetical protein
MRWPLTSVSEFLTTKILRQCSPSFKKRYLNLYLVFLISGIIHLLGDYIQGVPLQESGSFIFFLGCALGIMLEDGVQGILRSFSGVPMSKPPIDHAIPLWKRMVGFVWVIMWLSLVSPYYILTSRHLPKENRWYVPWSVAGVIGLQPATYTVIASGLILSIVFGTVV